MSSVPSCLTLSEGDLALLLESDALTDGANDIDDQVQPIDKESEIVTEAQKHLLRVASQTVPLFGMPHRSVSNVTICPAMHFSWHNVSASPIEEKPKYLCCLERSSSSGDLKTNENAPVPKEILSNVFGVAQPGEVLAIMGSSGAGKTTLLNVLAQRNLNNVQVDGSIKVNGLRVGKEFMQKVSAYVEQDDAFIGSLTVREQLRFVALLRMGKRYTRKEQQKRVEVVMKDLGLMPSADTVIATKYSSRLSGGEKKRLAFAAEILTSPPILLCDEPTSGLDAFLAFQVVSLLKKLAQKKGMTIVLTIHQPSSQVFAQFDRIYMMAEGRVAFAGTPAQAKEAWANIGKSLPLNFNPADHYINTLAVTSGQDEDRQRRDVKRMCDSFAISPLGRSLQREARTGENRKESEPTDLRSSEEGQFRHRRNSARSDRYKSTWMQQLCALTWRNYKTTWRDPSYLKMQLFDAIIVAILTGVIYLGTPLTQATIMNVNGSIWQNIVNQNFLFNFSTMNALIAEIPKFFREHRASLYRVDTYFLARNVIEFPQHTLCAVLFSTIMYWMSGMVARLDAYLIYVLVSCLMMHLAISFSYLVACIFSHRAVASTVLPIFTIPALAFSGFYINVATLPIYFLPLRYLSYFSYAYEALAVNQWIHIDTIPGCTASTKKCLHNGLEVLESLSFHPSNMYTNIFILIGMIVVVRLLAFLALYLRSRKN